MPLTDREGELEGLRRLLRHSVIPSLQSRGAGEGSVVLAPFGAVPAGVERRAPLEVAEKLLAAAAGCTALPEGHAFRACELALRAQALADANRETCP
jgi:hypothetical protein